VAGIIAFFATPPSMLYVMSYAAGTATVVRHVAKNRMLLVSSLLSAGLLLCWLLAVLLLLPPWRLLLVVVLLLLLLLLLLLKEFLAMPSVAILLIVAGEAAGPSDSSSLSLWPAPAAGRQSAGMHAFLLKKGCSGWTNSFGIGVGVSMIVFRDPVSSFPIDCCACLVQPTGELVVPGGKKFAASAGQAACTPS